MLRKSLQIVQSLSLDVVLGAIISSLFVAKYLSVQLSVSHLLSLGIAIWLIYTIDHLADAREIQYPATSARHLLHQRHFRKIALAAVLLALIGLYLLTYLAWSLILWGVILSVFVVIYFAIVRLLQQSVFFHKELAIAVLYAIGIFLAPIHLYGTSLTGLPLILLGQYILLAFINVQIISWYECETDRKDGLTSYITVAGRKRGMQSITISVWTLFGSIVVGISLAYQLDLHFLRVQYVILTMGFTLQCIILFDSYFVRHRRYRYWADAVFSFPIVYLSIG